MILKVSNCARCGETHDVEFSELVFKKEPYTHYGVCPETERFLLMYFTEDKPWDKTDAIKWYKEITSGSGLDLNAALPVLRRGKFAEGLWEDPTFIYGAEYGALAALIRIFNLTREDLEC